MVIVTDPYGRNLGFIDRSPYYFFQVAPQLWTPFQALYFSEIVVAVGVEPGTSGSVARNSDH
jgi:hypothetical protein